MRQAPLNPRLVTAAMACACLASFVIGMSLPLPSKRFALVDLETAAPIAQGLTGKACAALLASYPQGMARACL